MKLDAASSVKVEINLPVPDPVLVNHHMENCDGDTEQPSAKIRKLTTVNETSHPNEHGTRIIDAGCITFLCHLFRH